MKVHLTYLVYFPPADPLFLAVLDGLTLMVGI